MLGCRIYPKWMNNKKVEMTTFVNVFIRSVIYKINQSDMKHYMTL